jgi:DNA-binding protein HU-beta
MTKEQLIEETAVASAVTKTIASRVVNQMLVVMEQTLKDGEEINIKNFGKFTVEDSKATTGRNPKTGEKIKIPARKRIKFTAGEPLKRLVN